MRLGKDTIVGLVWIIGLVGIVALVSVLTSSSSTDALAGQAVKIDFEVWEVDITKDVEYDEARRAVFKARPQWIEVSPIVLESSMVRVVK